MSGKDILELRLVARMMVGAGRALRTLFDQRVSRLGITRAQFQVLYAIRTEPGRRQIDLAAEGEVEPITLARTVDRLEEAGLVERRPDSADRRVKRLYLAPRAEAVVAAGEDISSEMLDEVFTAFSPDDVVRFRGLIEELKAGIAQASGSRKMVEHGTERESSDQPA